MTPRLTVVVPTRNRAAVVPLTVRSLLAQRGVELDVVVVDEASDDDTVALLERMGDPRLRILRRDAARGAGAARNCGLAAVEGEWVAFCDDDDLWAPTKAAAQLDAMATTGASWSCSGSVLVNNRWHVIDHQRPPTSGDVLGMVLTRNLIPGGGSGVVARTDLVRDAGCFNEEEIASEDWDLWIRLAQRSPIASVDEPLVAYRIWPGSKSRDVARIDSAWRQIVARYEPLARELGVQADRVGHRRHLAKQHLRSHDRLGAARTFLRLAVQDGVATAYPRALAALVAPAVTDRVGTSRAARRVPREWREGARRWIDELVATTAAPGDPADASR